MAKGKKGPAGGGAKEEIAQEAGHFPRVKSRSSGRRSGLSIAAGQANILPPRRAGAGYLQAG